MLFLQLQNLVAREDAQDLIEYVLLFALIALGTTVGMQSIADGVSSTFTNVGTILTTHTSG